MQYRCRCKYKMDIYKHVETMCVFSFSFFHSKWQLVEFLKFQHITARSGTWHVYYCCCAFANVFTTHSRETLSSNSMECVSQRTHIYHIEWISFPFAISWRMLRLCVCVEKEWMWKLIISGSNFVARTQVNLHFFPPLQEEKKGTLFIWVFSFSLTHLFMLRLGFSSIFCFIVLLHFFFLFKSTWWVSLAPAHKVISKQNEKKKCLP